MARKRSSIDKTVAIERVLQLLARGAMTGEQLRAASKGMRIPQGVARLMGQLLHDREVILTGALPQKNPFHATRKRGNQAFNRRIYALPKRNPEPEL